jgi:hypothetical protein
MFVESILRLFSLVNLLVTSRVKSVEPAALARALRMLPRSKPGALPQHASDEIPAVKPAPADAAE